MEVHPIFRAMDPRDPFFDGCSHSSRTVLASAVGQSSRPKFTFAVFTAEWSFDVPRRLAGPVQLGRPGINRRRFRVLHHLASRVCIPYCHGLCSHGSASRSQRSNNSTKRWFAKAFIFGLGVSLLILVDSVRKARTWALPTGEASLTFFPANSAFLVAALTGTVALWLIAEQLSVFNWLSDLGRTSLTVYVLHFVPFALFHDADEVHQWSSYSSTAVVVAYTIIWALVGTWLHRQAPRLRSKRS